MAKDGNVPTGGDGVAKYKVAAGSATVTFKSASALSDAMTPMWSSRAADGKGRLPAGK